MAAEESKPAPSITLELPNATQGPPWPPSEIMDKDGHFVVVGFLIQDKRPVPSQAAIVSKDTVPPLDVDGRESFDSAFGADYQVIRHLDLSAESLDRGIELYSVSYGPRRGDFGGGPRMPRAGESRYNLNATPPFSPDLFPLGPLDDTYTRPRSLLHQVPLWGLEANDLLPSGAEAGVAIDPLGSLAGAGTLAPPPRAGGEQTVTGLLHRIAAGIERLTSSANPGWPGTNAFRQLRQQPITLGGWLQARGQVTITLTQFDPERDGYTAARFDFVLRDLLPHAVYVILALRQAAFLPATHPHFRLPDPLGLPNVFITDSRGYAEVSYEVPHPFADLANDPEGQHIVGLVVSYKSDYQNWGANISLLGPGADIHVVFNTVADGTFDLAQRFPVLRTVPLKEGDRDDDTPLPEDPVEKALAGIGGREALQALTAFSLTSTGTRFDPGEVPAPGDDPLLVSRFTLALHYDVAGDQLHLTWKRAIEYPVETPTTYTEIISGEYGFIQGRDGGSPFAPEDYAMVSTRVASVRRLQYLLHPHLILRTVAEDPTRATVHADQVYQDRNHHVIAVENAVSPISLFVDATTGTISKLSTQENDYRTGDSTIEVFFEDWQATSQALRFPAELEFRLNGQPTHREKRPSVVINPELESALFALPEEPATTSDPAEARRGEANAHWYQSFISLGFPLDRTQTAVEATELSPGVYLLAGGSHNSLAVERARSVVIVDAPLYEARSLAVIEWVANHCGGKPISHIVNTHFHTDHAGGLRTYVAIGARVVTALVSADFIRELLAAPHTVFPDRLQQEPQSPIIETVPSGGKRIIASGQNPMHVHHVTASHAVDMLVVYLPETKLLFNVDMWAPGQIPLDQPLPPGFYRTGALDLYNFIAVDEIDVEMIAGGHGSVGPFSDLRKHLGRDESPGYAA